jgi:hypothetical protein
VGTIASDVGVEDRGEKRKKKKTFEPWCQILEVGGNGRRISEKTSWG